MDRASFSPGAQSPVLRAVAGAAVSVPLGRIDLLMAVAGGLCLSFVDGIHHVFSNQTQYFLLGYRIADPQFIPRDWFVWSTTQHHFALGYLQAGLMWLGDLQFTGVAANVLLTVGFALGLHLLVKRFCRHPLPVFWMTLLWLALCDTGETGLGGFDLLSSFLQPSSVAGPLFVLGTALLLERRYLPAGICLGLGGLFHNPILAAMAPGVLVLIAYCRPWRRAGDLLSLGLPLVAYWGTAAVFMTRHGLMEDPAALEGVRLLVYVRSPHHHLLSHWSVSLTAVALLWIAAGAWAVLRAGGERRHRELRAVWAVSLLVVAAGVVLALWPDTPWPIWAKLNLMTVFRIAGWPMLLGLILLLDRWVGIFLGEAPGGSEWQIVVALMLVAGTAWALATPAAGERLMRIGWIVLLPVLGAGVRAWRPSDRGPFPARVLAAGLLVVLASVAAYGLTARSTLWRGDPTDEALRALRRNTPEDAVVVVPLDMERTRIVARRAIVVDQKAFPAIPAESIEWYRRICDVCGLDPVPRRSRPDFQAAYRTLDTQRALRLKRLYGASHVVVERMAHHGDTTGLIEVYRGNRYRLFRIP